MCFPFKQDDLSLAFYNIYVSNYSSIIIYLYFRTEVFFPNPIELLNYNR